MMRSVSPGKMQITFGGSFFAIHCSVRLSGLQPDATNKRLMVASRSSFFSEKLWRRAWIASGFKVRNSIWARTEVANTPTEREKTTAVKVPRNLQGPSIDLGREN